MKKLNEYVLDNTLNNTLNNTLDNDLNETFEINTFSEGINENMFNEKTTEYKGKEIGSFSKFDEVITNDIAQALVKWIKGVYKINVRFDESINDYGENVKISFKTPIQKNLGLLSGTFSGYEIFTQESIFYLSSDGLECDKYIPLYLHIRLYDNDNDKLYIDRTFNMNGKESNIIYYDLEDGKLYVE